MESCSISRTGLCINKIVFSRKYNAPSFALYEHLIKGPLVKLIFFEGIIKFLLKILLNSCAITSTVWPSMGLSKLSNFF